jgi:hypothetical protein
MFEEYSICPYTGLRSFTEEESLYFKGREENIESATEQLQRNKFLMLTGASGDGKSSLVYAGIVPNARAGFLKSKYTQWSVADFRPERSPFKNLCTALAAQLEIVNVQTVKSELQHGFSALVDLYKNSKRFVDIDSVDWQQADEKGKAELKREASNLIILVDQFEEFFTNPENYHRGVPSRDSNLVLNLLLETARIALEENLPIYVVFTMRSDFIGQCAAFRGLPEYIGFSQFFVPRLNRTQLQQVIEEPAVLSGNKISRRLTERLIHDLTEGVDQLPILQHALNQIWHAASNGKEEMDLLHYAMVGGMPVNELPDEHVDTFKKWFDALPSEIKACYHEPNLQNVLDTHTNKLYEQAADYYKSKTGKSISDEDAKSIIKAAFICLTKIDQSRAVRNRMTLKEISNILGRPEFGTKEVGAVLNIFREPGNTFIRPFITNEPESLVLKDDDVLDITHESLIRNWEYLEEWAKEEFDNYAVSLDFEQQLGRWVESGKSNGFLLSIGQLTYFENWYNKVNPNIHWIARYLPEEIAQNKKLTHAEKVLTYSADFLKRSAHKHIVTRTIMHYGPKRMVAVVALLTILILSSFAIRDYLQQQNSYVLKSIHQQTLALAANPKVTYADRISLVVEELKLGMTSIPEVAEYIADPLDRVHVVSGIATLLVFQGGDEPKNEIIESLILTDSLLNIFDYKLLSAAQLTTVLTRINEFRVTLEFAYQHNADAKIDELRKWNAQRSSVWANYILMEQPEDFKDMLNLNLAIEHALNYQVTEQQLSEWLSILSPFENKNSSTWLKVNYNIEKFQKRGAQEYGFRHNGLYQLIAYLYAAQGNSDRVLQCIDTLLRYSQQNYQQDYASGADNAADIAAVYFHYDKSGLALDAFIKGYCQRKNITEDVFYERMIGRTLQNYYSGPSNLHFYNFMDANSNLILQFPPRNYLNQYFNKYKDVIKTTIADQNQRNFRLALAYKNEGIMRHFNKEADLPGEISIEASFETAIKYYKQTDKTYLEQSISLVGAGGADQLVEPRKFLFIFPDIRYQFHPLEPRSFMFFYYSDVWMNYILDKNHFNDFYPTNNELAFINSWLKDYNQKIWAPNYFVATRIHAEVFEKLDVEISKVESNEKVDLNFLYLYAGNEARVHKDTSAMLIYYRKLKPELFLNILRSKEFPGQANGQALRLISYAVSAFATNNHFDEAYNLLTAFKKPINRSSVYAFASLTLQNLKDFSTTEQRLLDSAKAELNRVGNITIGQPHRQVLAYALTLQDPLNNTAEAKRLIKNLNAKFIAQQRIVMANGFNGLLYHGQKNFPPLLSDTDQAVFNWFLLYGYSKGFDLLPDSWYQFDRNIPRQNIEWIIYIDENI